MESGTLGRDTPGNAGGDADDVHALQPRSFSPARPTVGDLRGERGGKDWVEGALQDIIDDLTEQIALVDEDWTILAVNKAWADALAGGLLGTMQVGANYFDLMRGQAEHGSKEGVLIFEALKEIGAGTRTAFQHAYFRPGSEGPEYKLLISAFHSGGIRFATIARYEVSELMALTRRYRRLERSMVRVQEEERRRIGRELHDSTAQLIVALQLCMIRLKTMHQDQATAAVFAEIDDTLDRVNQEIRALSFLLHPPSLDDRGLVEALDAMARGFARRTGLRISFWFDGTVTAWEGMIETMLYRLAQEALANVHRHAQARHVGIRLAATRCGFLHLVVEDDGIGIPMNAFASLSELGVGIAGMRSRVREIGGRFSIRRTSSGTCLIASVPLQSRRPRPVDLMV